MNNPFLTGLSELTEKQITEKIDELTRKYFMTANPQVREQMAGILDMYRIELEERRIQAQKEQSNTSDELDKLINIK